MEEPDDLGVAAEGEGGLLLGRVGDEVEEVPLRHQRDVLVRSGQPGHVGDLCDALVELHLGALHAALRQRGEALAEPELVEQREGGCVHGVAAEVTQEVGVLLEDRDLDPGPGHEKPEDEPGRAAADDEAGRALAVQHALNSSAGARCRESPR